MALALANRLDHGSAPLPTHQLEQGDKCSEQPVLACRCEAIVGLEGAASRIPSAQACAPPPMTKDDDADTY